MGKFFNIRKLTIFMSIALIFSVIMGAITVHADSEERLQYKEDTIDIPIKTNFIGDIKYLDVNTFPTVTLLADGNPVETYYFPEIDQQTSEYIWNQTATDMPLADPDTGKDIVYSIDVDNEYSDVIFELKGDTKNGFEIDFIPTTSISVLKVWVGEPQHDSVSFNVLANGVETGDTLTVTKNDRYSSYDLENVWIAKIMDDKSDDLELTKKFPLYDTDGNFIEYSISETSQSTYRPIISKMPSLVKAGSPGQIGFIAFNMEETSVSVEKNWVGGEEDSVTFQLLADGKLVDGKTLTLSSNDQWSGTFEGLKKYNYNEEDYKIDMPEYPGDEDEEALQEYYEKLDGFYELLPKLANPELTPINYSIEEVTVDGYDSKIEGSAETGFTVTNTKKPEAPTEDHEKETETTPPSEEETTAPSEEDTTTPSEEETTTPPMGDETTGSTETPKTPESVENNNPKTGDNSAATAYVVVLIAAVGTLSVVLVARHKSKKN